MIPYGKQLIDENDIKSVIKVLRFDFLTQGPLTPKFENLIKKKTGSKQQSQQIVELQHSHFMLGIRS